ncbi:MAG: aspartyl/asparaginyl beta-hydroxylase domain-containing protein [Steroidobacteraceae bacterium]
MKAIDEARLRLREGRLDEAERLFRRVLRATPDDVPAGNGLATVLLRGGEARRAVAMLEQLLERDPNEALTQHNLGRAYDACGQGDVAARHYRGALRKRPELHTTRLRLAELLERLGDARGAVLQYARALRDAQRHGRWLDPQTTPPGLVALVETAVQRVEAQRRTITTTVRDAVAARQPHADLSRFDAALPVFLGDRAPDATERRRPVLLLLPDLPAAAFHEPERIEGLAALCGAVEAIGAEALQLPRGAEAVTRHDLLRAGEPVAATLGRCPTVAAALQLPTLARIRAHAPRAAFLSIAPGTRVTPARGATNACIVGHLVLGASPGAGVEVDGQQREWRQGEWLLFDDSFGHEFRNRGDRPVELLAVDLWHPDSTDVERDAVAELIAALGDFTRALEAA